MKLQEEHLEEITMNLNPTGDVETGEDGTEGGDGEDDPNKNK
ncbi:hypothetical protein [uncultured Polaribacter sp.]|nr:hypothetical protein [uncultured Polaribacter sp.]